MYVCACVCVSEQQHLLVSSVIGELAQEWTVIASEVGPIAFYSCDIRNTTTSQ